MNSVALDAILAPADAVRAMIYRAFGRFAGPWMRDRGTRVALLGTIAVLVAFALAVGAPLWLLAVGPIALGVPHVLADLRYLWVQPGFHRRRAVWVLVVPALGVGAFTGQVSWGIAAAGLALFAVPASRARRAIGLSVVLPMLVLSLHFSTASTLIFAHAHNAIALALWWAYRPGRGYRHGMVLGLFAAIAIALGLGAFDSWTAGSIDAIGGPAGTRALDGYARSLAPFADPVLGARLVVLYAFAQSMHYAVWLRLVPEDARPRGAPRTFRSTYRALRAELGWIILLISTILALALAGWAVLDLGAARDGYLRFAVFHGHLELAAAALFFAGGRPARTAS